MNSRNWVVFAFANLELNERGLPKLGIPACNGSMDSIPYKPIPEGESLQVHVFKPDTTEDTTDTPAVLFFHGGGWSGGTPEQFFPQCRELAEGGYVAISAEYRVGSRHGTSPMDAVSDARSCVRWVLSHATGLGFNPALLFLAGGSAGGHLALASLLTSAFDDPQDDAAAEPQAAGLVLFNPVADAGPDGYGFERVKEVLEDFSPLHAIHGVLPPVLILTGSDDTTTPVSGMRAFRDKAISFGGTCELVEYAGQTHGFFNFKEGNNPYYRQTLDAMRSFLENVLPGKD